MEIYYSGTFILFYNAVGAKKKKFILNYLALNYYFPLNHIVTIYDFFFAKRFELYFRAIRTLS